MHFVAICQDRPDTSEKRAGCRSAHLAYLQENDATVKLGGPFLDANGQPCGSLLILSCADEAAARAFLSNDPYAKADLFASVELRPYRPVFGASLA